MASRTTPTKSPAPPRKGRPLTHDDIARFVGDLEDTKIAAILAIAPTMEELEEAVAWAEAESDVMGELNFQVPQHRPGSRLASSRTTTMNAGKNVTTPRAHRATRAQA